MEAYIPVLIGDARDKYYVKMHVGTLTISESRALGLRMKFYKYRFQHTEEE